MCNYADQHCFCYKFYHQKNLIISLRMSVSARKAGENRDAVGDNETLFDFLKRKKKFNLENTINKSLQQQSVTKKKFDLELEDQFPQMGEDRTRYTAQYMSSREAVRGVRQNVTPKKIEFEECKPGRSGIRQTEGTAQNSRQVNPSLNKGKSFLSMISPLKTTRAASALEQRKDQRENLPKSNKKQAKIGQNYTRKNVTKCINSIKETVSTLHESINTIKQKSHSLSVQFQPIFNYLSETSHPLSKQVGQLRNKLKNMQSFIDSIETNNADDLADEFHKNIQDHLQFEEVQLRKQLEKVKSDDYSSLRVEKQKVIDSLQSQKVKLIKQNDILVRKLQKIQNKTEDFEEAVTERQMNYVEQIDRLKNSYQSKLEDMISQNRDLQNKCQQLEKQTKGYQKQLKSQRMAREELENRYRQEVQQITEVKDAYLLNQIMILKAEFNSDITRINQLHKLKQNQLLDRVSKRQQQMGKFNFERGCDKQIQNKILEEANLIKQENMHLKSKADCIITDMYRMNEELFQHWMALKDIKMLTTRLGHYPQVKKIYEDLSFNDYLFR